MGEFGDGGLGMRRRGGEGEPDHFFVLPFSRIVCPFQNPVDAFSFSFFLGKFLFVKCWKNISETGHIKGGQTGGPAGLGDFSSHSFSFL